MTNIAIIGASGAIGSPFVEQFSNQSQVNKIYAFSRSEKAFSSKKVIIGKIDLLDEASIVKASEAIADKLDAVIVASGVLHDDKVNPEKSLRDLSAEKFAYNFAVNATGPALVMKYFLPKLQTEEKAIFAALSARVGSISDNQLGGWYAYRAAKAALNMLIKNTAIEMNRRHKKMILVGLHPGTVDSNLSKPFSASVAADHLFSPEKAVADLIKVLEGLSIANSGKIFAYDGKEILP